MPLNQGEKRGESRGVQLKQELSERLAQAPEPVTRNPHGQSLDDAREAFRTEWQAKIQEKQLAVGQARRSEEWFASSRPQFFAVGAGFGAFFAVPLGLLIGGLPGALVGAVGGAMLGWLTVVLSLVCESWFQKKAERLEWEVQKLEHS